MFNKAYYRGLKPLLTDLYEDNMKAGETKYAENCMQLYHYCNMILWDIPMSKTQLAKLNDFVDETVMHVYTPEELTADYLDHHDDLAEKANDSLKLICKELGLNPDKYYVHMEIRENETN